MPSSDLAPLVPLGAAYCFVLGACLASFLQVVAQRAAVPGSPPFYKGRSHCDACGHALGAAELVPLFSWLLLRGRCRHCGARVPASYPLAELCGGLGAALCFAAFPFQWGRLAVALPAFFVLFLIALQDAYTMEIPDLYSLLLCLPALAALWAFPETGLAARLIGAVCVSLPLLLITLAVPGAFGGGDLQLMAVCGFLLGWKQCLAGFFLALLIAGAQAVLLLASGRAKAGQGAHMPFGPALCAGCFLSLLWGGPLVAWYMGFFQF